MATSFYGLKSPEERNGWEERGRGQSGVSGKAKESVTGQRQGENSTEPESAFVGGEVSLENREGDGK